MKDFITGFISGFKRGLSDFGAIVLWLGAIPFFLLGLVIGLIYKAFLKGWSVWVAQS